MGIFDLISDAATDFARGAPFRSTSPVSRARGLSRRGESFTARRGVPSSFLDFVDGKQGANLLGFATEQQLVYEQERFIRQLRPFTRTLVGDGTTANFQFVPPEESPSLRLLWMIGSLSGAGAAEGVLLEYNIFEGQATRVIPLTRITVEGFLGTPYPLVQQNATAMLSSLDTVVNFVTGPIDLHRKQPDVIEGTINRLIVRTQTSIPVGASFVIFGMFEVIPDPAAYNWNSGDWEANP